MKQHETVPFAEAFRYWLRLGFVNFGGPAGQIALMHEDLVERRAWISEERFLHALNYCMLLPGPEAQQLAIYIGWLLHGGIGGLVAGVFFVLPAFFLMLALSWIYVVHGDISWVDGMFFGVKAAVIAIVVGALIRIGGRALTTWAHRVIAAAAFVAIFAFDVWFPVIVLLAGLLGALMPGYLGRRSESVDAGVDDEGAGASSGTPQQGARPRPLRAARVLVVGLVVWIGPLALVAAVTDGSGVLTQEAWFFSQAALVTFGGAYAVLSYIGQAAVERYGWLLPGQMVTGLGLAESTPGPLIMVTEFVGFVGAYRNPGGLDPAVAGLLGASIAVWATFVPSFIWIFLGAPYIERLRGRVRLDAALSSITAAVVGVIANLALFFALHTLFAEVREVEVGGATLEVPDLATLDPWAVGIAALALVAMLRFRWRAVWLVALSAAAGLLYALAT